MEVQYQEFKGINITVMGLGRFGGGVGAARFLAENGARVTVTDLKSADELADSVAQLKGLGIDFILGRHELKDFTEAHMVVVNPAVPRDSEYILAARRAGTRLTTEVGLFVERCPAIICGVTGSNGKSTTVSMLQSILEASNEPHYVGGNIGRSLLPDLASIESHDYVVLELSSFQLDWLGELGWSPKIAAVLPVMPNHLDRHGTFKNYVDAKASILKCQKSLDKAILVRDNDISRSFSSRTRANIVWIGNDLDVYGITAEDGIIVKRTHRDSVKLFDSGRLRVPGQHMVVNAMAAIACAIEMGVSMLSIGNGLAAFNGLPHRLENVGDVNGVKYFNDSKATTPEAAAAGVGAFDTPVIPILGGSDKKVAFDDMAQRIATWTKWAAVIGETSSALSDALSSAGIDHTVFGTFEEAFQGCVSHAVAGDTILLSPGCASYDMFSDYEARGDEFKRHVNKVRSEK